MDNGAGKNEMAKNRKINVQGNEIVIYKHESNDYISLTDIARYKDPEHTDDIIKNWLRNRNTVELLGFWEMINNPDFKPVEFDGFRKQAGLNSFVLTPKRWIENTNAIGIVSKSGRNGADCSVLAFVNDYPRSRHSSYAQRNYRYAGTYPVL